jgi:predicted site-specific integrase-resolvase
MPKVRSVTVIPPTIGRHTHIPTSTLRKRRVAGYARVSTDSDEQFTSYETQIDYYTQFIKSNPEWEFVCVYTDAADIIGLKQNPTETGVALVLFFLFYSGFRYI